MYIRMASIFGKEILEPFSHGMIHHTSLHAHVHAGKAYNTRVSSASVAAAGSLYLQLTIPDEIIHLKAMSLFTDGSRMRIRFTEKPTSFTTGTVVVPSNNLKRFTSSIASPVKAYSNPTSIVGGTLLEDFYLGSGSNQFGPGALTSDVEWLIQGPGTWIIQLTNTASQAAIMYISSIYYLD